MGGRQQPPGGVSSSGAAAAAPPAANGSSVDVSSMSWPDKEKVLRLLFAKIANQAQQAQFANLPPHALSLGATAAGGTAGDYDDGDGGYARSFYVTDGTGVELS